MKLEKARKRDKARKKRTKGMQVTNKSIFLIQEILIKKGQKARQES